MNLDDVARLGCVVCRVFLKQPSPAEIHHLRIGAGMGRKGDKVIPLCPIHHRLGGYGVAYHAGRKGFEDNYGTELELWEQSNALLKGEMT